MHEHLWVRAGRIYSLRPRVFASRQSAHQWAARNLKGRLWLVLPCSESVQDGRCRTPRQESKRAPRGSLRSLTGVQRETLAGRLARELDAPPGQIRVALDAAIDNTKGVG